MRRIYLLFIIACAALVSCAQKEPKAEEVFDTQIERVDVKISTDRNCQITIPNPEDCTESMPEIQLYKKKKTNETFGKRSEYDDTSKVPMVDLSYLGINEPVYITNFAIGHMGKAQDIDFDYESERIVKGNCLVITFNKKESDNDEIDRAYLAVLDYKNKKKYLIQTGLASSTLSKLNLCDFTGDGMDEIIVSGVANKWIEWQM